MASPYSVGGLPDHTDVEVGSVFIAIFALAGIGLHLRTYYTYGYKFIWSLLCFAFCAARCLAIGLRISLSHHLTNKPLACCCQILISAGVAILFVVNLQLSRRFMGQLHPRFSAQVNYIVTMTCQLVDPVVIIVIVAIIQTYAASDPGILSIDRKIRIFASVFFVVTAFMPIAVVSLALALHAVPKQAVADPEEKEPVGSPTTALSRTTSADATVVDQEAEPNPKTAENKSGIFFSHVPTTGYGPTPSSGKEIVKNIAVIIIPAVLLTIEQGIRAAQIYYVPKPGVHLPWYMSKASFWTCIFGIESVVITIFGVIPLPELFSNLRATA